MLIDAMRLDGPAQDEFISRKSVEQLEQISASIRIAYAGWGKDEPQFFPLLRCIERRVSEWLKIKRTFVPQVQPVTVASTPQAPKNGWNPPSQRRLVATRG